MMKMRFLSRMSAIFIGCMTPFKAEVLGMKFRLLACYSRAVCKAHRTPASGIPNGLDLAPPEKEQVF